MTCLALANPDSRAHTPTRPEPAPQPLPAHWMQQVQVGDLVFTCIGFALFREVAQATGTWTNHVGLVIGHEGGVPLVAESRFPLSGVTTLPRFVHRSQHGRVAVLRLRQELDAPAQARLQAAARRRLGVFYDTGFNLHSRRQFCSRFVHEVLAEALGQRVGEVQTFAQLFQRHPQARLGFWRAWYFGRIPWQRQTLTPASLLADPQLTPVLDGHHRGA